MRAYADSSFVVKLILPEVGSDEATDVWRSLRFPSLPLFPLHDLEVEAALRQKEFHAQRSATASVRLSVKAEIEAAFDRLARWKARRWFFPIDQLETTTFRRAVEIARRQTGRLGCRSHDILHVAAALESGCKTFFTLDRVQARLAEAEGLKSLPAA